LYLTSLMFHWNTFDCTIPGTIAPSSASTHKGFNLPLTQSPYCIF
jgi:hypothetical protein